MLYKADKHHRRSLRLSGYDYTQVGAYFVTVCTQDRASIFGEVINEEMQLNQAGPMVDRWWKELEQKFPNVITDTHIVMPNHFHGIVILKDGKQPVPNAGADLCVCPGRHTEPVLSENQGAHTGAPLPRIVQWFKTMTTNEYIRGVNHLNWPTFQRRLWQRNYYERVIRTDRELDATRQYIIDNPAKWAEDRENPQNAPP